MSFVLVADRKPWEIALEQAKPKVTPAASVTAPPEKNPTPAPATITTPPPAARPEPPSRPGIGAATLAHDDRFKSRTRTRERRWSRRVSILRHGHLTLGENGETLACTVLDMSQFGALIDLAASTANGKYVELPECFLLVCTAGRIRSEANCMVRWRGGGRIGVSFIGNVRTFVAAKAN